MNNANVRCCQELTACHWDLYSLEKLYYPVDRFTKQQHKKLQYCAVDQCPVWGNCGAASNTSASDSFGPSMAVADGLVEQYAAFDLTAAEIPK